MGKAGVFMDNYSVPTDTSAPSQPEGCIYNYLVCTTSVALYPCHPLASLLLAIPLFLISLFYEFSANFEFGNFSRNFYIVNSYFRYTPLV